MRRSQRGLERDRVGGQTRGAATAAATAAIATAAEATAASTAEVNAAAAIIRTTATVTSTASFGTCGSRSTHVPASTSATQQRQPRSPEEIFVLSRFYVCLKIV